MNQPEVHSNSGIAGRGSKNGKVKGKGKGKGPRKGRKKAALIWLFFVALFGIVCAVVGYLLVILNGERILSANINKLNLDQASIIVDSNDNQVAKLYVAEGNREFVPFADIPKIVQDAFVATEDKRFYEHSGVDLLGIGRALVKDIIARSAVEGASTITQQLAKNLFLNADKTIFRKGTEASIALALEQQKSKQEILELYLNRIYFGKGQYGVKTAAKYYFGVSDLDKLKLWQVATLAGIPKAPGVYNPISNPEKSMERRAVVLKLMFDQGLITEEEKEAAAKVVYKATAATGKNAKYLTYVDYVVDEAVERTGLTEEELRSAGYTIKTTINTKAQLAMEQEFANAERFDKSVDDKIVQGSMVIMDQHDGSLIAMVGGRNYETQGWNRVTKKRQPGSSFKPIMDYGPAIETGDYFPWSLVQDEKKCYGDYCPSNTNGYKGAIPMKEAIKESRNVSAVWLLNEIGIGKGMDFAEKLGIDLEKEDRNLSSALGGLYRGVTPLQMARAYGAFANGGKLQDPHSILEIVNSSGKSIYKYDDSNVKRVMDEKTAYYVTDLLKGVVQKGGTGVRAAISGRTVAGKTGTTQAGIPGYKTSKNRDAWFVGFTPEWTAAVWMGYDETDKQHLLDSSSSKSAQLFSAVMSKALEGVKRQSFPVPADMQEDEEEPTLPGVSGLMASYSPELITVELMWGPVEGKDITYKVYRKGNDEAEFRLLAETAEPAYDDLAILPDQTFTYYVTAYQADKKLESEPSEQVTVTITSGMEVTPPPGEGDGENIPPDQSGEPGEATEPPPIEIEVPGESPSLTPPPTESPSETPSPSPSPNENAVTQSEEVPVQNSAQP
ncbi:transglycosylase domain-containing protein [Cohnella cholangitidis]|uniref:PBP1A family penicillin-binding protein n=1 Tax=Cohnella cholangitidis TaxID=2598458 RepID=A0A7G5C5T5_9BACL|nr:PBP1A family penicillin-binding protein [Cohnella cholangitidis]QMV44569.1 PBP1A family penicillin-binding protein [Cohnella cholangitidis]